VRVAIAVIVAAAAAIGAAAQNARPLVRSQLVWVDRTGKKLASLGSDVADFGDIELSPDRTKLAAAVLNEQTGRRELWIYDVETGRKSRVDTNDADENWLIWSPDGTRVVYNSQRTGGRGLDLYGRDVAAKANETLLATDVERGQWPVSWSSDGRNLLVVTNTEATGNDIWVLPLGKEAKPYEFLASRASENWAAFSPNGKWVAFSYNEDPRGVINETQLFVTTFPKSNKRWLVSARGGFQARWRRDGKELFFLATNGTLTTSLMVAEVDTDGTDFEVKDVKKLFDTSVPYPPYHAFDVSADGQRILVNSLLLGPSRGQSAQR
jgi:Tol biopolymer transport system component